MRGVSIDGIRVYLMMGSGSSIATCVVCDGIILVVGNIFGVM